MRALQISSLLDEDKLPTAVRQYSAIRYDTMQYIQYNAMQYDTTRCSTMQYTQYNAKVYDTMQYNTTQFNTMQYHTAQYISIRYIQSGCECYNSQPLPQESDIEIEHFVSMFTMLNMLCVV